MNISKMFKRCLSTVNTSPFVKLIEIGSAGIIQLNRPKALNAINTEMFDKIYKLLKKLEHEKDITIFKGSGKIFCAGGDVKEISSVALTEGKIGYTNGYRSVDLIKNYKKPFVTLMDGLAFGGASYYSIPAKYCVATERTLFSMPETALGYFNDAGATYFLPRIENNVGIYMGLTGAQIKGFDVKKLGLATHYIESHKLDELESRLVECKTHGDVEKYLNKFSSIPLSSDTELDQFIPQIKACLGAETVEKIYENLTQDGSDWAVATLKTLNRMSPLSLKVVHRSLLTAKSLAFRECLKMEFRLVIHHHFKSDLKEGARAVLIDRDFKPKWSRKNIYDVTEQDVARFFQPSPDGAELSFE